MRILLISPFFPPEVGSASHLYFELGQALRGRQHEVMVLTGLPRYHVVDNSGKYRRRLLVKENYHGLDVVRVLNLDIPWHIPLFRGLDQWMSALSIGLAGLGLPDFDVAMVYSPPLPLALTVLSFCRLRRRPVVVNIQDLFPQSAIDLGVLRNSSLIRIFRDLESFLYRHADMIMVHSQGNREYVMKAGGGPERVLVVPNWVDTHAIKPGPRDNGFRMILGLQNHFIVSFAGIMGYSQDLETVLKCARILINHPDIAFLLVGDGVEKKNLITMAETMHLNNVHFLPIQPKDKYPEVLGASDLCLVTLRREVQTPVVPSKILSIMAAGRPVLAGLPLEGDAPRLIRDARCGLCIPPGEPEAMAQSVLKFYQEPALREEMGVNGRQYAETHLSLDSCVVRLERHLQEVQDTKGS